MIIAGLIFRPGPPFPAVGPARTARCLRDGIAALDAATRNYGTALRQLVPLIPGGIPALPPSIPMHVQFHVTEAKALGESRIEHWFRVRDMIEDWLHKLPDGLRGHFRGGHQDIEKLARASLVSAVDAFNLLDDIASDYELSDNFEMLMEAQSTPSRLTNLGRAIDRAHLVVHRAGELVGGLFGCSLQSEDDGWFEACPVQLMHVRLGNSPGWVLKFACNICGNDPGDCGHELSEAHKVTADRIKDECNICGELEPCSHATGQMYVTAARANHREVVMREVSLVPRPRDPLARMKRRGIETQALAEMLGFTPTPDMLVLCHACMYPCEGIHSTTNWPRSSA